MIFEVIVPDLGATGGEVLLEHWLVQPGEFVKAGAPLFVVTTDKATVEVEAFASGYVHQLLVEPGSTVALGSVVALLVDRASKPAGENQPHTEREEELSSPGAKPSGSLSFRAAPEGEEPSTTDSKGRLLASPLARRMAREAGIDLTSVRGSGPQGEILKVDVLQAMPKQHSIFIAEGTEHSGAGYRREPLSAMRRSIAARTQQSKNEIPHFYATVTLDMTEARSLLAQAAGRAGKAGWQAPTVNDLVIMAVARALRQVPQVNASLKGEEIIYYQEINIGLVVGLPDGLLIPVLHQADRYNLFTVAAMTHRLKQKAQAGNLSSGDLSGSTFTISNLGMYGLDSFVAVINPPEAGVLAVGAMRQLPAVREGQVVPRWLLEANLSVDHRVVDGVRAALFLEEVRRQLEEPAGLALEPPQEISE